MTLSITDICMLFEEKGHRGYSGEPVSQLEHALQSAYLAERSGAPDALVVASLLHDLGHLVNDLGETPTERGIDDSHQHHGAKALGGLFSAAVTEPIRMHVDAKRYLCFARPEYRQGLSPDSKRSLELQGGVFTSAEADAFIRRPYAQDAVQVRLWDDTAKVAGAATPSLAHFAVKLRVCALPKH